MMPFNKLPSAVSTIDDDANKYEVEYLIGISQSNLGEPWRIQMNAEIQAEADKHEEIQLIFTDASQSNDKQIQDVEKLLQLGIDLLIISPNEATPLTPVVQKAYGQVPVIILDRAIDTKDYTLFIGADNYAIGKKAGLYLEELFPDENISILEIQGLPGSTPATARHQGFLDAIADAPHMTVEVSLVADWLRDDAEKVFSKYLNTPVATDIDVVYAHNDPMAFGAYKAAKALGKEKDMVFIGIDGLYGDEGGITLVKNGILKSTFIYPSGGKEAILYALQLLQGYSFNIKDINLRSQQITLENISEYEMP